MHFHARAFTTSNAPWYSAGNGVKALYVHQEVFGARIEVGGNWDGEMSMASKVALGRAAESSEIHILGGGVS
jgi:hypothetical protein